MGPAPQSIRPSRPTGSGTDRPRRRFWIPVAGSFVVYLIPLVGAHAVWPVAVMLRGAPASAPWWLAANLALALMSQAAVGLLLAWCLSGPGGRWLIWLAAAPGLIAGLNVAY